MFASSLLTLVASAVAVAAAPGSSLTARLYPGCGALPQTKIETSSIYAKNEVTASISYLTANPGTTNLYNDWFGVWSSGNFATVSSTFNGLSGVDFYTAFNYNCLSSTDPTCGATDYYGYIDSVSGSLIYLCPSFFALPNTGTTAASRTGVLIQLALQFTAYGGLTNTVTSSADCENLPKTDTPLALENAASYGWFAANA